MLLGSNTSRLSKPVAASLWQPRPRCVCLCLWLWTQGGTPPPPPLQSPARHPELSVLLPRTTAQEANGASSGAPKARLEWHARRAIRPSILAPAYIEPLEDRPRTRMPAPLEAATLGAGERALSSSASSDAMVALALDASRGTAAVCLLLRNGTADLDGEVRHG